jgi:hypothetical protein
MPANANVAAIADPCFCEANGKKGGMARCLRQNL